MGSMQWGKEWEATIQRSMPPWSRYTRIPDAGPAVRAARSAGATTHSATRPYDARIDWRSDHGVDTEFDISGRSLALEAKSVAGTTFSVSAKARHLRQLQGLADLEEATGVPGLLLLEYRGAPEDRRWWWVRAPQVLQHFESVGRMTLRLAEIEGVGGMALQRLPRGRSKVYLDVEKMFNML